MGVRRAREETRGNIIVRLQAVNEIRREKAHGETQQQRRERMSEMATVGGDGAVINMLYVSGDAR